jgi:hypothetical protein
MFEIKKRWRGLAAWFWSIGWVRRRILLVMLVPLAAWVITALIVYFTWTWISGQHADEMFRGLLAAWVAELLFFTIVGVVVAVITLRDPTQESFDDRMKILFGKTNIPDAVLDHNKQVLARLCGYVQTAHRSIYLEHFDEELAAYRSRTKTEYEFRNLLPDLPYNDTMKIRLRADTFVDPHPREHGRVVSIKMGEVETMREPITFQADGFNTEVPIEIPPNEVKKIVFEYYAWLKLGEPQTVHPQRVVEHFTMDIINQTNQNACMEIDGDVRGVMSLLYSQPFPFPPAKGVKPGGRAFSFRLVRATEPVPAGAVTEVTGSEKK